MPKRHVDGQCNSLHACKVKACNKRHPRVFKRYSLEKFCKFKEECAYLHLEDTSSEVKNQVIILDRKESRHDLDIRKLKDEVKELRSEIKLLTAITKKFSETSEDILADKIVEKEVVKQNVPKSNKFKCDKCDCSFKREITLRKHKNTRHAEQKRSKNKELYKGQFGFVVKGRKKNLSEIVKDSIEQNEEKLQNEKEVQSVQKEKRD